MKRILALASLLAFVGVAAGCNTLAGFGKDVEKTGYKIQEKATK